MLNQLQKQLKELIDKGYVKKTGLRYEFTDKLYEELAENGVLVPLKPVGNSLNLPTVLNKSTKEEWELTFIKFISEAQVPRMLETDRGNSYYANKFNEDALKVFFTALNSGYQYDILVKSVMLYYKSKASAKKAIGNYFTQGDWKSDYLALAESATEGTESLQQHIKDNIDDNRPSQYGLG